MALNGYDASNSVFVAAVLLKAFDFQSPPQTTNENRLAQSVTKMNVVSKSVR